MQNQHAIKFGLMAGFGTVIFLLIFYWIDKPLMLSPGIVWSTMMLYLIGMYMAAVEERKAAGGYLEFKPALKAAFLVFVVANALYYGFNYLFYNFVDTEMLTIQKGIMRQNMEQVEGMMSAEQMATIEKGIEELNFNFSTILMTYFSSLAGGFLLAALIALIVRRRKPAQV